MKLIIKFLLLFFISPVTVYAKTNTSVSATELFNEANSLYQQEKYEDALGFYRKASIMKPGASLHYNMGNCYFRLDRIGESIVHYRKALLRDPRNSDLLANLRYAREKAKDAIKKEDNLKLVEIFFFWHDDLTLKETALITSLFYAFFMLFATVRFFKVFDYQTLLLSIFGFLFVFFLAFSGFKYYESRHVVSGAIINKEVSIYSAHDVDSVVLFKLHDGAEFQVLNKKGDWLEIQLGDKKKGWVVEKFTSLI